MKLYFANGLFSTSDRMYNDYCWDKLIQAGWNENNIYMPQKNLAINDKTASATSLPIYNGDTTRLKEAAVLIAVLDGVSIDAGVASEIGWVAGWNECSAKKKIIIGIYSDNRDLSKTCNTNKNMDSTIAGLGESQYDYKNLYTVGCCKKYGTVVDSIDAAIEYLKKIMY